MGENANRNETKIFVTLQYDFFKIQKNNEAFYGLMFFFVLSFPFYLFNFSNNKFLIQGQTFKLKS